MARSGRFGRLPRSAPSLGNVMASLAREMAAQKDRNVVDAWQEGGSIDGVKITDEMLLQHYIERRDAVTPDDPMWAYYDNLIQNYQFSVAESKMTLQYADKKVGDLGMAAFYDTEAAKHPVDSEASRDLLRTAAAYRERARAEAAAGAARGRAAAAQAAFNNVYASYQKDWDSASAYVTHAARLAGILGPNEDLTDMATTAEIGREDDFTRFMGLFDDISNSSDPAMAQVRTALEGAGLGGLTYDDFLGLADRNSEGFRQYANISDGLGDRKAAQGYRDDATEFDSTRFFLKDTDEFARYDQVRRDFMEGWLDTGQNPYELRSMRDKYANALKGLLGQSTSEALHGTINNELLALYGDPSGQGPVEVGTSAMGDLADTAEGVNLINAEIAAAESGKGFFSPYTTMPDGSREQRWSLIEPTAAGDPKTGMLVMAQMGGKMVPVWVPFAPVISHAGTDVSPYSGRAVTDDLKAGQGQDTQIGVTYALPGGTTMYGIYQNDGSLVWFDHPPFVQKEGVSYGDPIRGADGSLTFKWALAGVRAPDFATTGLYVTPSGTTFDPRYIVDPDQLDPKVTVPGRFSDPYTSYYTSSPEGRLALLGSSDRQMASMFALTGMPEDQAASLLTTVSGVRDDLRQQANQAWARGTAGALLGPDYDMRGALPAPIGEPLYDTKKVSPEIASIRHDARLNVMRQRVVDELTKEGVPIQPREAAILAMSADQIDGWLRSVQASRAQFRVQTPGIGPFSFTGAGGDPLSQGLANAQQDTTRKYELPPLPDPPRAGAPPPRPTPTAGATIRVPSLPVPSFLAPAFEDLRDRMAPPSPRVPGFASVGIGGAATAPKPSPRVVVPRVPSKRMPEF